ncbi:MAG: CPXCG motif-containing cysteine-rich protein [Campylobacterota bacterium]|nr:CPXCG motif-containing cysteine-rich protein [Campylobacterota bacterium]
MAHKILYKKRQKPVMEHFFTCPYCWEQISMILDNTEEVSDYIEDCEVCCRPIELFFKFSADVLVSFETNKMEGI